MQHTQKSLDSSWEEAFSRALGAPENSGVGLKLFFEARSDLVAEASSRFEPSSTETLQCGLAAAAGGGRSGDDNWACLANPEFEDVERLAQAAASTEGALPTGAYGSTQNGSKPSSASGEALEWLDTLHRQIGRLSPSAHTQSRWVQFDQQVLVGSSGHPVAQDRRQGCRVRVQAWMDGPRPATAVAEAVLKPTRVGSGRLAGPTPEELGSRLIDRLRQRSHPLAPPPGEQMVVLGPGAGGILIHEIVGHALEADTAQRGSWLTREEGDVAPVGLTVVDDPRRGRAAWRIDDEGQRPSVTCLIARGRVQAWLHSRATAARADQSPTGHGRRASYREPVRPRMGCTFIAAGRLRPEEVVDGVDGIYVRRMEAASIDPGSGRATFRVTDADMLKGGRIESALSAHLLQVDARTALSNLDRIADDLGFDTTVGSCQRDGQSIAVSVGAPTIRIGLAKVVP